MDRRNFLCKVTAAGTVAAAGASAAVPKPKETRVVNWKVNGFYCITCSVGLEVMLRGMPGVTRASAAYPANTVVIGFDEHMVTEKTLRDFISTCGFSVA